MYARFYLTRLFIVILVKNAVSTKSTSKHVEDEHEEEINETLFADVIKNITRVNNVLQDLIKNYEKLQKIYKSQEIFDTEPEVGKQKDVKYSVETTNKKETLTTAKGKNNDFPATHILKSEESIENTTDNNNLKVDRTPMISALHYQEKDKEKVRIDDQSKTSSEESSGEIENEDSNDETTMSPSETTPTTSAKNNANKYNSSSNSLTQGNILREKQTDHEKSKKLKKQIIQTEVFHPQTIWKDVVHKPMNLILEKEIEYRKNIKPNHVTASGNKKKVTQGVKNKKHKRSSSKKHSEGKTTTVFRGAPKHPDEIVKEQEKTRMLRKAYGESCLNVVTKKCFKACAKALKKTRKTFVFTSEFVTKFKEHSATACKREFKNGATRRALEGKLDKNAEVKFRKTEHTNDGFLELIRNGYLVAACLPEKRSKRQPRVEQVKPLQSELKGDLNTLRVLFERACQSKSSDKCRASCRYAMDRTCQQFQCAKIKKTELMKACNRECKLTYGSEDSDESDDSDDSSDSDDDSGDEEDIITTTKRVITIITKPKSYLKQRLTSKSHFKPRPTDRYNGAIKTWRNVHQIKRNESVGFEPGKNRYMAMQARSALS